MQFYCAQINPNSALCWPGTPCMKIMFAGCDFRCGYCNTPGLVEFKEEHLRLTKDIKIEMRQNAPYITGVMFTGGEPGLQRQALLSLAREARRLELKIGIQTNGSKPFTLSSMIREGLVDHVSLDLKAPLEPETFESVTRSMTFFRTTEEIIAGIRQTIDLLEKAKGLDIIVKTTMVPALGYDDMRKIAKEVRRLGARWILQRFDQEDILDKGLKDVDAPSERFILNIKERLRAEFSDLNVEADI